MSRHARKPSDDLRDAGARNAYALPTPIRDTSAPCASGDNCMTTPPARVEIRGEQCRRCLQCQREMRARLRAR